MIGFSYSTREACSLLFEEPQRFGADARSAESNLAELTGRRSDGADEIETRLSGRLVADQRPAIGVEHVMRVW